jgi:hypothetical protein
VTNFRPTVAPAAMAAKITADRSCDALSWRSSLCSAVSG